MHIQAPAVMPKWDWALNGDDALLMQQWEKQIISDAMAHAKKVGGWVNIFFNEKTKEVSYSEGEFIGQASSENANISDLRKVYAIKYL